MKYDVFFPTPIESIADPTNDNVDVCVTTADGEAYTLVDYASAGKDWETTIAAWLPRG